MRIKSHYKDYYDSVMGLGVDTDLTYIREISLSRFYFGSSSGYGLLGDRNYGHTIDFSYIRICFCGYDYTCIQAGETKCRALFSRNGYSHTTGYNYFYDIDSLDKFINNQHKDVNEAYYNKKKYYKFRENYRDVVAREFEKNGKKSKSFDKIQKLGCPVLVQNGPFLWNYEEEKNRQSTVHNPPLRLYEFNRVKDSYTAYQEITQFLANVAHPNKPIPAVSDKDMIVAKGFDLKTSFRKEKTKGK